MNIYITEHNGDWITGFCLYKWPWTLHSYEWSLYKWSTTRKRKPGLVLVLVLVSVWTQPYCVVKCSVHVQITVHTREMEKCVVTSFIPSVLSVKIQSDWWSTTCLRDQNPAEEAVQPPLHVIAQHDCEASNFASGSVIRPCFPVVSSLQVSCNALLYSVQLCHSSCMRQNLLLDRVLAIVNLSVCQVQVPI